MSSEAVSFRRYTCDRCGKHEDHTTTAQAWALLTAQYRSGPPLWKTDYKHDLCGDCANDFRIWMERIEDGQ